jgi:cytoskeletal protein CcmA (bactofilin family)
MKHLLSVLIMSLICSPTFSQWNVNNNAISTNQNVGIGTNTPAHKLDINGDLKANNITLQYKSLITRNLSDTFLYQEKAMGHYAFGWMPDSWNTSGATLWQSAFGGIKFFTKGTFRMAIHHNGNVGIGTENPIYKLDVDGDIQTGNIVLQYKSLITRKLNDNFLYKDKQMGHYAFGWMPDSWNTSGATLWQSAFGGIKFFTKGTFRVAIHNNGNMGIGVENPTRKLDVNGDIKANNIYSNGTVHANEVKVEAIKWADFVFDDNYKLPSIQEVKAHIIEFKHLPDIPSEKQIQEEGINIAEMQSKLLQKIEELTLYIIQQDQKNKELEQEIKTLKAVLIKK